MDDLRHPDLHRCHWCIPRCSGIHSIQPQHRLAMAFHRRLPHQLVRRLSGRHARTRAPHPTSHLRLLHRSLRGRRHNSHHLHRCRSLTNNEPRHRNECSGNLPSIIYFRIHQRSPERRIQADLRRNGPDRT